MHLGLNAWEKGTTGTRLRARISKLIRILVPVDNTKWLFKFRIWSTRTNCTLVYTAHFCWWGGDIRTFSFWGRMLVPVAVFVQRLRSKPWTYISFIHSFFHSFIHSVSKASNWLRTWFLAVVLTYRLFMTLYSAMQELGWAMSHSDFLAWLNSATLKILSEVFQLRF